MHNLAAQQPERVAQLVGQWEAWAKRANVLPWIWQPPYGEKAAPEAMEKLRVLFNGDKLSMKDSDQEPREVATFKLDPAAKVKTVDLMLTSGPEKGKTSLGIYAWDGDNMKLCIAKPGSDRPTEFATKTGSEQLLLVLKKEK